MPTDREYESIAAIIIASVQFYALRACTRDRKLSPEQVDSGITPEPFVAVGYWYDDFSETIDAEVRDLLAQQLKRECRRGCRVWLSV